MNTFDPKTHSYYISGSPVPSTTQVIKEAGLLGDTSHYSPEAAQRGTLVHEATAMYDRSELDVETLDPQLMPYLNAWVKFCADTGMEPVIIEQQLYTSDYRFAGTIDRAWPAQSGKHLVVCDIKTGALPVWLPLQLGGYSLLCNALEGMGVELRDDGTYRAQSYGPKEIIEARKVFLAALTVTHWKRSNIRG